MKKIITITAFLLYSFVSSAQTFSGDAVDVSWNGSGGKSGTKTQIENHWMSRINPILEESYRKIDNLDLQSKIDSEGIPAELLWKTTANKAEKTSSSFLSGEKPDRLEIVLNKDGSGKIYLYKSQNLIGRVRCQTNHKDEGEYRQPDVGTYKVSAKEVDKVSEDSKFKGAKMPYALLIDPVRGIWIHQGNTSGDSGGCPRVSYFVARQLFRLVDKGTLVVVKKQP